MVNTNKEVVTLANGGIVLWVDDESSIHIKSVTQFGDPVELNLEEVNELCEALRRLASRIS